MSKSITYSAIRNAKRGDISRVRDEFKAKFEKEQTAQTIFEFIDAACTHDTFRQEFAQCLVKYGVMDQETAASLKAYSDEEKEMMAAEYASIENGAVVPEKASAIFNAMQTVKEAAESRLQAFSNGDEGATAMSDDEKLQMFKSLTNGVQTFAVDVSDFIETNVLPTLDVLMRRATVLEDVNILFDREYKKLIEFGQWKDAESLAKGAAGTPSDITTREGVTLDNTNKKIQASTTISRRDLMQLETDELARMMAEFVARVKYLASYNVFYANNTSNQWQRGLKNTVGSDATNKIGAIETITSPSGTILDRMQEMDTDMSRFLDDATSSLCKYYVSRPTKLSMYEATNANGQKLFEPNQEITINNKKVMSVDAIDNSDAFLSPLAYYTIIMAEGFNLLTDGGVVNIKEDTVTLVSNVYADGSPRKAFKQQVGSSTDDNHDYNLHRWATIR